MHAETDTKTILEVRDLCVSFRKDGRTLDVLEGLNFTLGEGEILTLVGESGSGKSMTALAIMGLIDDPNARISGSVRFRGKELIGQPAKTLRRIRGGSISMIFQDALSAMTPVHTIGWQIAEQYLAHNRVSTKEARERAVTLLAEMGMPDPARQFDRYPHQLSGGMRQRAMIAMALSCNPALLIADEPTTALDVMIQAQILGLVRRLREDYGSSIIFVTHDMGVVSELSDRVAVMYAGRIVEYGTCEAVLERPGHPYTQALLDSIPPMDGPRPHRLSAIPGLPPAIHARPPGCAFAPRCRYRHAACGALPATRGTDEQQFACHL